MAQGMLGSPLLAGTPPYISASVLCFVFCFQPNTKALRAVYLKPKRLFCSLLNEAADSRSSLRDRSSLFSITPGRCVVLRISPPCFRSLLTAPSHRCCRRVLFVQLFKNIEATAANCIFVHFLYANSLYVFLFVKQI